MSYEITEIDRALFYELVKVKDEKVFVEAIFTFVSEQCDRKQLTEYIRANIDNITSTEISLAALDYHIAVSYTHLTLPTKA